MIRGYAAIGLHMPKTPANVGSVLRAAHCYGVALVAKTGQRYRSASTDTTKAWRHLPLLQLDGIDILEALPSGCVPVAIELCEGARSLTTYQHPERAFYVFGPEDGSVPTSVLARCRDRVAVPTAVCMNLAATANVVLYDRMLKRGET